MTTDTKNTKTARLTPKLLLKTTSNKPIISTTMFFPTSTIATGSFYLPIKQKNNRKGGRHPPKHLRKPPSFDTYIHSSSTSSTTNTCGYMSRTPSLSSSYSSTSSLVDNVSEYSNEDMMYGYGSPKSSNVSTSSVHRLRRGSSAYKVRFADTCDDSSSIVSSTGSIDEWGDDIEEEDDDDDEDYIFVPRHHTSQHHYFSYHKKNGST
ncbi:hypothetical protein C1645_780566 [Glomus cerebriforme]|uniref:Uncharacterized protein n=1 Tax=Glomus cerebriforme TaxID=658196 RepID=A0A397SIQ4_9GLOM|nr:hypothetical protein C1645_780566 [Glomus cerebriforme]